MINAIGFNNNLTMQVNTLQNHVSNNKAQMFGDILNSKIRGLASVDYITEGEANVKSTLRAMGVNVNIRDTPRYRSLCWTTWTSCDFFAGVTIAPNILERLSRDEDYLHKIKDEIHNWFFVEAPKFERSERMRVGCRGDKLLVLVGMNIDKYGRVVKWAVALWKDAAEESGLFSDQVTPKNINELPHIIDFSTQENIYGGWQPHQNRERRALEGVIKE